MRYKTIIFSSLVNALVELYTVKRRGEILPSEFKEAYLATKITIVKLGSDILPALQEKYIENDVAILLEIMGEIGDPKSISFLIQEYEVSNFMGGIAALNAIRQIRTQEGYEYINSLLKKELFSKEEKVSLNMKEIARMCDILGDWQDKRGMETLQMATSYERPPLMPKSAIEALATYSEASEVRDFLIHLAQEKPVLAHDIYKLLKE